MALPCILLGNEPRSYREVLATALQILRPQVELRITDAANLDRALAEYAPDLVVCSCLTPQVEVDAPAWILLHPGGGPETVVEMEGQRTIEADMDLNALLAVIDTLSF